MTALAVSVPSCTRWFGDRPVRIAPVAATGFSGSTVVRLLLAPDDACFILKSFPAAFSAERACWVQRLVAHLRTAGCTWVPEVVPALDGRSLVAEGDGRLWEVTRSMPGVSVATPSVAQACVAARRLADMHRAAARMPGERPREGVPAAIIRRNAQARNLLASPWRSLLAAAADRQSFAADPRLHERFEACVALFARCRVERLLAAWMRLQPPHVLLQACLRDIWHEHVFFADRDSDTVTAVIDLHAAAVDTPANDLARLAGSWAGPAERTGLPLLERWREAFAAYEAVRPFEPGERRLVPLLHATGIVLGLDHWLRWTWTQGRVFADLDRALARIDFLLAELPVAVATVLDAGDLDV